MFCVPVTTGRCTKCYKDPEQHATGGECSPGSPSWQHDNQYTGDMEMYAFISLDSPEVRAVLRDAAAVLVNPDVKIDDHVFTPWRNNAAICGHRRAPEVGHSICRFPASRHADIGISDGA